ncbi:restriction endonuclease subunit S [Tenacibaculum finnmarkense]|uniref:restriction endonuclease subunit S n=1 Tax=Tenacibaculum finnmarkense TaxID=2781243 RepID=UPI001EFC2928|nr:restriction endonuclease subunit S [Tenacibaculum finnmarkense]
MIKFDESRFIKTTLGELVSKEKKSIISGPFGSNVGKRFFQEEGIPLIRGNNLSKGQEKFKDEGFVFLTKEKANELNCYAIKNDLIFTAVGTIGQVGIIDEKLKFEEYVISNKQLRARFDESIITPLFAYYWFSSYWVQKLILQRNVGSTVPLINLSVLKGLPITLPKSLKTQNNIVNVLENISSKIAINNKINAALEAMAKTLYDYWFVQFDFPDKNGKPYKSSEGKMIFNEELKREIPVGWEVGILGDIGKISMCKRVLKHETSSDEEIPFFKISTFGKDAKTFISRNLFESYREKYSYPKSGDILISAAGTIGKTVIFDGKLSYFQDSNIVWLANDESKIPNSFLYYYYQKEPWIVTGGSTIKRLYNDNIRNLKICFPPLDVLKHFSKIVNPMLDKQQQIVNENKKLSELRDWLLPMLMNGQVSVGEK